MFPKSILYVSLEASIVGALLILIYKLINLLFSKFISNELVIFISGFLFHFIFEFTGLNRMYSLEYCKLIG